jgi:cytochrome oxidase assembly protein ShyY1
MREVRRGTVVAVLRVLRQRRWIGFTAFTIFMLLLFVRLGIWQFGKLGVRRATNSVISANSAAPAAPYADVLASGPKPVITAALEWRTVEVTGHWDVAHQVLLRNRTYNSADGYEVITPLVPASGPALLVNRGWIPQGANSSRPDSIPVPQAGIVTVTAWLRQSQPPHSANDLPPGQVLAINAKAIAAAAPYPVVDGYAILVKEDPAPASAPTPLPGVVIDDGPYLSYGIQWFLFTGVAVVGWWIFVRKEADESDDGEGNIPSRDTVLPDSVRMG